MQTSTYNWGITEKSREGKKIALVPPQRQSLDSLLFPVKPFLLFISNLVVTLAFYYGTFRTFAGKVGRTV